ncbi:PDPR phosphatase, partial [Polypterus senegalus]|nr:PDPR phosphatase [Polypterus senegalus]
MCEIQQLVNCPESFTPDMRCIMGETPSVNGYFVLVGMNSSGLSFAGGAGRYLAEWMTYGFPSENVWPLDIKRFGSLQSSRTFLRHRVMEVMPLLYELKVPRWDFQTGRQLRTSPLYDRLDAQGARWMEKHGFERAKYFVPPGKDLLALDQSKTFYKPDWFDIVGAEVKCCKEAVCVVDMSSFTKFELSSSGEQALDLLQRLCANDLDVPVGHIVHTGMLNERGGYENDCSVVRLSKNSFFIISPTDQQVHCWSWMKQHMPNDHELQLEDVTWKFTALNLIGPRAMDVLSELSYVPMTPEHFPSLFCKHLFASEQRDDIIKSAIEHAGNYIGITLRVRKDNIGFEQFVNFRLGKYSTDDSVTSLAEFVVQKISPRHSEPVKRTLALTETCLVERDPATYNIVTLKPFGEGTEFIGRASLMKQRQEGVTRRFIMFVLEDHDTELDLWPWWGEPIYRNGELVGATSSSAYSYTLERHICLGFVQPPQTGLARPVVFTPDFINNGDFEIDIGGQRFHAKAKLYPFSSLFAQQRRRKNDMELSNFQGKE